MLATGVLACSQSLGKGDTVAVCVVNEKPGNGSSALLRGTVLGTGSSAHSELCIGQAAVMLTTVSEMRHHEQCLQHNCHRPAALSKCEFSNSRNESLLKSQPNVALQRLNTSRHLLQARAWGYMCIS